MKPKASNSRKAGQSIGEFCDDADLARSTYYTIPEDLRPRRANIGKRQVVIEPASEWLARIAAMGGIATTRKEA